MQWKWLILNRKYDGIHGSKTVRYRLKFIDSFKFKNRSLSSLVDNLTQFHSIKWPCKYDNKICKEYKTK